MSHLRRPDAFAVRLSALATSLWLTFFLCAAAQGRPAAASPRQGDAQNAARRDEQVALTDGPPVAREIAGGQAHSYRLSLAAGEFVRVAAEQKGIDLIVSLYGPGGERLNYFTSPDLTQGPEAVSWVVAVAGSYRVEVRAQEEKAAAGRYELRIVERRAAPSPQDRDRVTAERAFMEGEELRKQWTADSLKGSLAKYADALRLSRAAGDRFLEGTTLNIIGLIHSSLGDRKLAFDYFMQAHPVRRAAGDLAGEAQSLHNVASIYLGREEREKAFEYYDRALKANEVAGDRAVGAFLFTGIGGAYDAAGQFQKGLEFHERALASLRALDYHRGEAYALSAIGSNYFTLGEYKRALEYFEQALPLLHALGIRRDEVSTLNWMAWSHLNTGDYQKAVERFKQAYELHGQVADLTAKADTFSGIAQIYSDSADYPKALEFFGYVLDAQRQLGERSGQANTLTGIGLVHFRQGEYRKAVENFNQALVTYRDAKNPTGEGIVLSFLMYTWKEQNKQRLAVFYGKQAINSFQEIRANLRGLEKGLQKSFLKTREEPYRVLADLLIAEGRLPEAQQVLGLLKEEEYFEFVRRDGGEASSLAGRAALNPAEAGAETRYREIGERLTALGRERGTLRGKAQLTPEEEKRLTVIEADLEVAGQAFQQFLDKLAEELGGATGAGDRVFQLRESQGLMETLGELRSGAVALYTVTGGDKYRVILITPDVQKAAEYDIKAADLARKVAAFREALQDPASDPRPLAQELYRILVGPVAKDLDAAHAETLMWSLDGVLRYVPMAALHDGRGYLVERYRNVVFTPASRDRLKDEPTPQWKGLGFGVSKAQAGFNPLPAVPEELRGIIREEAAAADAAAGGVLPGKVMLDEAFTVQALKAALRQRYPVVHIASHFSFQPGNETNSFLLMGDGSHLSLAQIKSATNLFSGVELLTLSACDTATSGAGADGKEVEGFAVLAQRQGAKAVMASLWPVADDSTRLLMQSFYRLRDGQAGTLKAEALRQAQLSLLRGEEGAAPGAAERSGAATVKKRGLGDDAPATVVRAKNPYAHPYFWAPFILIGNWR